MAVRPFSHLPERKAFHSCMTQLWNAFLLFESLSDALLIGCLQRQRGSTEAIVAARDFGYGLFQLRNTRLVDSCG